MKKKAREIYGTGLNFSFSVHREIGKNKLQSDSFQRIV